MSKASLATPSSSALARTNDSDVRRLRHHLELTGDVVGLALHARDFDREDVATGSGDGETRRETGDRRPRRVVGTEAHRPYTVNSGSSTVIGVAPPSDTLRGLARDRPELTLERTHTGLPRPAGDDRVKRRR